MFEPLTKKKRRVEHSDLIPTVADECQFNSDAKLLMMNSSTNFKQKFEAFLDNEALINRKLPKELLLRIFSFLDITTLCRCAQVSKKWNCLALDGSNWQNVDLFKFQCFVEGKVVENLSRRCGGFLKRLSLEGCENVDDKTLRIFSQNCQNLSQLRLVKCKKISDQTLNSLGKNCSLLHYLDTNSCTQIGDQGLKWLSEGCPQLSYLDISWCDKVSDRGISYIANGCPKLKYLLAKGNTRLGNSALIEIGKNCSGLKHLKLHKCINITDEGVRSIAEGCHELELIGLSECSNIHDESLQSLARHCPSLQTLEVASCSHLTDTGFVELAKACRNLRRMDLEECVEVTDRTLHYLSMNCFEVVELTLSHCERITDEGIQDLCSGSCSDHLKVLELDNIPLLTDTSLEHLVNCQNLNQLELYDCQQITKQGIHRLQDNNENLEIHAYFAPVTPQLSIGPVPRRLCPDCRCTIL